MKMPIEKLLMSLIVAQVPFYSACNFGKTGQVSRTKRCCFFCISVSETGWLFGSKKVDKVTHYQQGNELENIIVLGIQLEWGLFFVTKRQSDPFSARDIFVWCCFPVFVLRAHLAPFPCFQHQIDHWPHWSHVNGDLSNLDNIKTFAKRDKWRCRKK